MINYLLTDRTRQINSIREDHNMDSKTLEKLVDLIKSAMFLSGSKKERYHFANGYCYTWKRGKLRMSMIDLDD